MKQSEKIIDETIITYFNGFKSYPHLQMAQVASPENPLALCLGGTLSEIFVAYETYGQLSEMRDNVILVVHPLTGDSHLASHNPEDEKGWWESLIGPGRLLDTNKYFIICSNVLGGCQGTTGPASIDSTTGKPYGVNFPQITIRDMVHVQKRLLELLNIDHLSLVIGGSMGGMQALEWAVTYPDFMDGVISIAAPGYASAQAIAYNKVAREAIMIDPKWEQGNYYGNGGPTNGFSLARSLGMITYQSEESMANKFGRKIRDGKFEIENYLKYQGDSLVRRFDANSYLYLLNAIDHYDLGAGYSSYEAALARVKAKVLVIGVSSDILYPPYQQEEIVNSMVKQDCQAEYAMIETPFGHDGFLIDFHLLGPILGKFVDGILSPSKTEWSLPQFNASHLAYLGARLVYR